MRPGAPSAVWRATARLSGSARAQEPFPRRPASCAARLTTSAGARGAAISLTRGAATTRAPVGARSSSRARASARRERAAFGRRFAGTGADTGADADAGADTGADADADTSADADGAELDFGAVCEVEFLGRFFLG